MNIGQWVSKWALLAGDRVMVTCDNGREFTFSDMDARVNRLANAFPDIGLDRGERVAVLFPNNVEFLDFLFATGKTGVVMVPLNFRLAPAELAYILEDSGVKALAYTPEFAVQAEELKEIAPGIETFIHVGEGTPDGDLDYDQWVSGFPADEPEVSEEVTLEDEHFIMYTSGTTGRPKGAVITHGNTQWNGVNALITYHLTPEETHLVSAPLFHIGALSAGCTPTIYTGGRIVLCRFFVPDMVLEMIEKEKVTTMFGIPVMFLMLQQSERFDDTDFSSFRFFLAGGAPCPVPLIEKYLQKGVTFNQGYGLTETAPAVSALPEEDALRKRGSAGLPLFHVDIRIFDENDQEVPPGEMGEIVVRGPNVFRGYWNNPGGTSEALRGGWFHTGDMGRFDEEGYLYIVDRKKDMIISGGENIYPAEVEDVLHAHPAVADVGVVAMKDEKWGEAPLAVVVKVEGEDLTEEEVIEFARRRLAGYKAPRSVVFVEELPRTPTGKILKKELRASYVEGGDRPVTER